MKDDDMRNFISNCLPVKCQLCGIDHQVYIYKDDHICLDCIEKFENQGNEDEK